MTQSPTLKDIRSELDETIAKWGPNVRFYADPNVHGIAWVCWDDAHEECESGGVGPAFEEADDSDEAFADTWMAAKALLDEIERAGYPVIR